MDEIVAHAVAVQQAKFGLLISAVASLTVSGPQPKHILGTI